MKKLLVVLMGIMLMIGVSSCRGASDRQKDVNAAEDTTLVVTAPEDSLIDAIGDVDTAVLDTLAE